MATLGLSTPGPRAIHPSVTDSRSLARCGILAQLLFDRMISQADDQGRLAGEAADLVGLCFPKMIGRLTVDEVAAALEELVANGMVLVYQDAGESYAQLVSWWSFQAGQRRSYPSKWPAPPGWTDITYGLGIEGSPATYRAAVGMPAYVRSESAASPQDDGSAPPSRAAAAVASAGTLPVTLPSALAGPRGEAPPAGAPNGEPSEKEKDDVAAAEAWALVQDAWQSRDLRWPPTDRQQAAIAAAVLNRPTDVAAWIREIPRRHAKSVTVIAHVLDRWRDRLAGTARAGSGHGDNGNGVARPATAAASPERSNGTRELTDEQRASVAGIPNETLREHVRFAVERSQPLADYVTADAETRQWVRAQIEPALVAGR